MEVGMTRFQLDIDALPTLPVIARQVLEHMNNPDSSIKDIASVVSKDQSMSTRILQLVNSAFYGFPKRIGTISHAISILGFETVKSLILGVSVIDTFKVREFDMLNFWRHSIETAALCSHIAGKVRYVRTDEAFTIGLIHDVGKLVFMLKVPEEYKLLLEKHQQQGGEMWVLEREAFDLEHAQVGAQIAQLWNFPLPFINAMEEHHLVSSAEAETGSLKQIVYVSNVLTNLTEENQEQSPDISQALQAMGLNEEELLDFLDNSYEEVNDFLNVLSS
jgi:putative nucleotidyltransferase with HDIG domain